MQSLQADRRMKVQQYEQQQRQAAGQWNGTGGGGGRRSGNTPGSQVAIMDSLLDTLFMLKPVRLLTYKISNVCQNQ